MKWLERVLPEPAQVVSRYSPAGWMQPYIDGAPGPADVATTWGKVRAEPIQNTFVDYALRGFAANATVAAVERLRLNVFSEARFQWQPLAGIPGARRLFGTPALKPLEEPWVGGTTGDLLLRELLHADLAGNAFTVRDDQDDLVLLRPDWCEFVLAKRMTRDGSAQIGWRQAGLLYFEGGHGMCGTPAVFLPGEYAHFAPLPDPLASYRGMSWLTPVIRDLIADTMSTDHKVKYLENAASPNLAVSFPKEITPEKFEAFVDKMNELHAGPNNAGKTMYTAGGADVTVIGANLQQMEFSATQGKGEVRIAAAGGIHPAIAGLAEGLTGSSLNAGNFGAARRLAADTTFRPLWRNMCGSLQVLVEPPTDSRLWWEEKEVAFLREDTKDQAEIDRIRGQNIKQLIEAGAEPKSTIEAVWPGCGIKHTGKVSVQLQEAGAPPQADNPRPQLPAGPPESAGG